MITWKDDVIYRSNAQTLIFPVSCSGKPSELIKFLYNRYSWIKEPHSTVIEKKLFECGKLMLIKKAEPWIMLFPIKNNCEDLADVEYITQGLMKFAATYKERGITSAAFGVKQFSNSGINDRQLVTIYQRHLASLPINIEIYW